MEATDCAIDGTVREASLDDGRPERCGTPEGDGILTSGAVRVSVLGSTDGLVTGALLGIGSLVAAGFFWAADFAGNVEAGLPVGGLALTAGFFTGALPIAFAAGLATARAILAFVPSALAGFALVFAALDGVFEAVLAFTGMTFTS